MQIAKQEDVFGLSRRKFIDDRGKNTYKLTDKGLTTGEESIRYFGLESRNATAPFGAGKNK